MNIVYTHLQDAHSAQRPLITLKSPELEIGLEPSEPSSTSSTCYCKALEGFERLKDLRALEDLKALEHVEHVCAFDAS